MDMRAFEAEASAAEEVDIHGEPLAAPVVPVPAWRSAAVLDRVEQVAIVALWVWLVWRVVHSSNGYAPLVLISETAVMAFTLIRRPTTAISLNLGDWALAIIATAAPLCIVTGPSPLAWLAHIGVALNILGNLGQAVAKLALRRSFGIAPANRGIKVEGPYRLVRHPMYAGYLLVHVSMMLMMPSVANGLIYAVGWAAQIRRMIKEEALLGQDPAYRVYMARVRWRLVPGLF